MNMQLEAESTVELRTRELTKLLKSRGLELRTDSALCSKYIEGTTELNPEYIVQRMCEMKYLYDYCNMKRIKKQVYYKSINSNKYKADLESSVSVEAEKIALEKYSGGKYPDKFPWEETNSLRKFHIGFGIYFVTILIIPIIAHYVNL